MTNLKIIDIDNITEEMISADHATFKKTNDCRAALSAFLIAAPTLENKAIVDLAEYDATIALVKQQEAEIVELKRQRETERLGKNLAMQYCPKKVKEGIARDMEAFLLNTQAAALGETNVK